MATSIDEQLRSTAVDAVDILNDLCNDITSSAGIYRSLMARKAEGLVGFRQEILDRVVMAHIVIAMAKVEELFTHPLYARVLGQTEAEWRRELRREIKRRRLVEYRNTYTGHIHCDRRGRPLRTSEMEELRKAVMNADMNAFLHWTADGDRSVRDLLYLLRDKIAKDYAIDPSEVLDR